MENREDLAEKYFREGYNCSMAVIKTFEDLFKEEDIDLLLRVSSPFGGGFGRMREVCGAFSSLTIIVGLLFGYSTPEKGEKKKELYSLLQDLASKCKSLNGSIVCKELLGLKEYTLSPKAEERSEEFYKKRPCIGIIRNTTSVLEEYLKEAKILK